MAGSDCKGISIHALREEGDLEKVGEVDTYEISIHALREEGDAPRKHRQRQTV